MFKKHFLFICAVFCALFSSGVCAQAGVKSASANPNNQQFIMEFSDGSVVVADNSTKTLYITNSNNESYDVSFYSAISSKYPDPVERDRVFREFVASLTDPEFVASVRSARNATDVTFWPYEMCGEYACIPAYVLKGHGQMKGGMNFSGGDCSHYLCPELPIPCEAGPCHPNAWVNDGSIYYSGFGAGWGDNKGGGTVNQQQLIAYDKARFENARQDACGEKNVAAAETMTIGSATVGVCYAAETPLGLVACGAGVIAYGIGLYKTDKANKKCQAAYPGPGNW